MRNHQSRKNYTSIRNHHQRKPSTHGIAEIELVYRCQGPKRSRHKVTCAQDAYQVLRPFWPKDTICLYEQFRILLLDRANYVLGVALLSSGGIAGSVMDPKLVFVTALKAKASSLILAHNHPSGSKQPSRIDFTITRQLKEAGLLLELPILDHLILTAEGYYSMADQGVL